MTVRQRERKEIKERVTAVHPFATQQENFTLAGCVVFKQNKEDDPKLSEIHYPLHNLQCTKPTMQYR